MESEFSTPHNSSRKQGSKIGQLIKACKAVAVELSHLEYEKEKWLKEMKVLETNIWSRIWDSEKWSAEIRKNAVMDTTHVASSLDKGDAADMEIVHSSGNIGQGEMMDKQFVHGVFTSSSEGNFCPSLRENSIAEMCILGSSQEKMSAYPMHNHAYERVNSTCIGSEDDPCSLCPKESFSHQEDQPADFDLPSMEHCLVSEEILPSFSEEQDISVVDTSVWNDDENLCPQNLPEMQWSNVSAGDCNTIKHSSVPEHETHVSFLSEDLSALDTCVKNGDENFWQEGRSATRWSSMSSHDCEGMKFSSKSEEQTQVSRSFDEEKGVLNAEACARIEDETLCSQGLPERIWSIVSSDASEILSENKESNRMPVLAFSNENNELESPRECKDKFEMEHETLAVKEKEGLENVLMDRKKCFEDVQSYTLELERAEMERNNPGGVLKKPSSELFNPTMDVLEFDYEGSKTLLEEAIRHATLLDKERQSLALDLAKHRRTFERACEEYMLLEKEMQGIQSNLSNRESNVGRISCESMDVECEKTDADETYEVLIAEFGKNEHRGLACDWAMESGKGQDMVSIEKELYEAEAESESESESEAFDCEHEEEDRCLLLGLLEECRSVEGRFTKIQPMRSRKEIVVGSFQRNIGFSEMASLLIELEVLKRVALERSIAMMPTVRST